MFSKKIFLLLLFIIISKLTFGQVSFSAPDTIPTGSFPQVVAVGDLNSDGLNDVALGTGVIFDPLNDCKIFIFYQNSSGGLNAPIKYPYPFTSPTILGIGIADLNNDNLNDIAFCFGDSIGIYFQNSAHTFNSLVTYFTGVMTGALKVGDLNNDGLSDIVVLHENQMYIRVFYQIAGGFNTASYAVPYSINDDLKIGDVNNDQLNDVVFVSENFPSAMYVLTQNSSGTLNTLITYPFLGTGFGFRCVGIVDLSNDGRNDIAVGVGGIFPNSKLYLYKQDSITGLLQIPDTMPCLTTPGPMEIVDLECNGTKEIVLASASNYFNIFEPDSITNLYGSYSSIAVPYSAVYKSQGMAIGDINNDGASDIVIANYSYGLIHLINQSSILTQINPYDTLVSIDTIAHTINNLHFTFTDRKIVNSDTTCLVVQVDSMNIIQSFSLDSIKLDSIYINAKLLCIFSTDTFVNSHTTFHNTLVATDTLFLSTKIDTILTPLIVIDTISSFNNFYRDTVSRSIFFETIKTLENNTGCSIIQKSIFLISKKTIVDSLKIDTTFIRSAITCSFIRTDSVYKNITRIDSTVITSDTSLYVASIDSVLKKLNDEFQLCNILKVYPIPSAKILTLEISDPCYNYNKTNAIKIELFNSNAQLIYANIISNKRFPFELDLSNYANSIYCLKTTIDGNFCIKKVIKEY